jgi:hypothetical protein
MFSYFNSVDESGVLAGDGRNTEPLFRITTPEHDQKLAELQGKLAAAAAAEKQVLEKVAAGQAGWEQARPTGSAVPLAWQVVAADSLKADKATLAAEGDAIYASGPHPDNDTYTISFKTTTPTVAAVRLELLADDRLPSKGPGRHPNGNPIISELALAAPGQTPVFKLARASFDQPGWESAKAFDGNPATGWAIHPQVGQDQSCVFTLATPLQVPVGTVLTLSIVQNYGAGATLGKFRLALSDTINTDPVPAAIAAILAKPADTRSPEESKQLADHYIGQSGELIAAKAATGSLKQEIAALENSAPTSMVMKELAAPRDAFVLKRGQYDRPGDKVERHSR